jgi:diguanylate cyclase (GGDEF)-like protein
VSPLTALLIDDDPVVHDLINYHLEGVVDRILHAEHPASGIALATHDMPDVILLDIEMPYMDGFQVCRELKQLSLTRDIPVVFLTSDNATHHVARGLDLGGVDYVTKPFVAIELQARVRAALRTRRLIELLRVHAHIDALTGLKNRGALEDGLSRAAAGVARKGGGFAAVMLDVDHFKRVNDTYGHGIGDEVLRRLGATIGVLCRPTDLAARYGGEEFALVLPETTQATAITVCERLLDAIRQIRVSAPGGEFGFTVSAGLAMAGGDCPADDVLQRADEALYHAKGLGRDRLVIWAMAPSDEPGA